MKLRYPDFVSNAFKSVQAWKTLSLVLVGILIFETIVVMRLAGQRNVLLIPQHLINQQTEVELNLGAPFSPDYLTAVAKGDAYALLNWTPENIEQQYGLFLTRMTPALRDVQHEDLLVESKRHKADGITQSFYVTESYVSGSSVSLYGVLVRSMAGKEVFRGSAAYEFDYAATESGLLEIFSVRQPDASRRPRATKVN